MVQLADIDIRGISVGGLETCIDLPQLKLAFDIGRCPKEVVARPTVLFTHAHMDHMGGVAYHAATREMLGMAPPRYVVPAENAAAFEELFAVWRKLDRSDLKYSLDAIGPGESVPLSRDLSAHAFRSPHRVPCQGYALVRTRQKLRGEFAGLEPNEIRDLKLGGTQITRPMESVELAFTGDTTIEVVEREKLVRTARVLIMEVTFLDERVSVRDARSKGHVHLAEVAERADLFENEALLLTHFSARYAAQEIEDLLDRGLPAGLRSRVHALLPKAP